MKKWWKKALTIVSFLVLTIVKLHSYDRTPFPIHAEELLYGLSGIFLIETGTPISWSTLDYPKENIYFDGMWGEKDFNVPVTMYKPFLDEPPLFSLLAGGAEVLGKENRNTVVNPSWSRLPTVLASLITMALVFFVAKDFFGNIVGYLAMVFYGVTPIFVFGSRMSVPENMIAMLSMVCLYLSKRYLDNPKRWQAFLFGVMAMVGGLMKPTGFFIAPLMIFLAIKKKRVADAVIIFALTLVGVAGFAYYGYMYDWELFKHIVSIQGGRFAGWTGLGHIFTTPAYDIFEMDDGWYLFAFIFSWFFTIKKKININYRLLSLFWVYWLMVAVMSGTENDLLPWYRFPTFPIMAIFGSLGLVYVYKKANFFTAVLVFGLLLSARFFLANDFRPTTPTIVFRITTLCLLAPSLLAMVKLGGGWGKKATRGLIVLFVVLGVFFNIKYIYSAFEIKCENKKCPIGKPNIFTKAKFPLIDKWLLLPGDSTGLLTDKRPWF